MVLDRAWRVGLRSWNPGNTSVLQRVSRETSNNLKLVLGIPRKFSTRTSATGPPPRWQRYLRRTGYFGLGVGVVWGFDRQFNASAIGRNLRTLWAVRNA